MEWFAHEGLGESELTFDLQPSGLQFSAAALTLPYQPTTEGAKELWPALRILQWSASEPTGRILTNTEVDATALIISADIFHFSQHQTKTGVADTLYDVGMRLGLGAAIVGLPFLVALDGPKSLGTPLTFDEISERAEQLVPEMFCEYEPGTLNFSIPPGTKWNELMGHLSGMRSLFTRGNPSPPNFSLGQENALAAAIIAERPGFLRQGIPTCDGKPTSTEFAQSRILPRQSQPSAEIYYQPSDRGSEMPVRMKHGNVVTPQARPPRGHFRTTSNNSEP